MKKVFSSRLLPVALVVLAIALALSQTTFGQSIQDDSLTQLIESQNRIASALEELVLEKKAPQPTEPPAMAATGGNNFQDCLSKVYQMPISNVYKPPVGWNFDFIARNTATSNNSNPYEHFNDLNGDGLVDYFYVTADYGTNTTCIYLNNGTKFEEEYICNEYSYWDGTKTVWNYRGDCADYS